jgi:hypothetical protein
MEQIQQHEWEPFEKAEECKHCWIKRVVLPRMSRYVYYTAPDSEIYNEEPACITRPAKDQRTSNCAACSMLSKGVKFRVSPPHTCGK